MDKRLVERGLLFCRGSGRVSFSDAMLWAAARAATGGIVYTFDERFPEDEIEVRQVGAGA